MTCPKSEKWPLILTKKNMGIVWFKYEKRTKLDETNTIKAELKITRNVANTIENFIITKELCEYYSLYLYENKRNY